MAEAATSTIDRADHRYSRVVPSWFGPTLATITGTGVIVRLAFAISQAGRVLPGDAQFYYGAGKRLAQGEGFVRLSVVGPRALEPTAQHPPLLPVVLALFHLFGIQSVDVQRIALSVVSASAVPIMGVLGRRLAGPAAGVGAALIAALNPLWFQPSGILMSESIYLVLIPLALLLSVDCIERPALWRFGALGFTIGLAVVTRSEAIDLTILLGVPVAILAWASARTRVASLALVLAGLLVVLGPWLVRNESQLGAFVLSDNIGGTLAGSYCPSVVSAKEADNGAWNLTCAIHDLRRVLSEKPPAGQSSWTEASADHRETTDTLHYIGSRLSQLPGLAVSRELAAADLGDWGYQLRYAVAEGRVRWAEQLGMILDWVLFPFAILGAVQLVRQKPKMFLVVFMPVVVNVALFYGSTRMRVAAEPSLALFGVIGILDLASRIHPRSRAEASGTR